MMRILFLVIVCCVVAEAQSLVVTSEMHHVRNGATPEWATFPRTANNELPITFTVTDTSVWRTLTVRQRDVRQDWKLELNGQPLGKLVNDEKDITIHMTIPPGALITGSNMLRVFTTSTVVDDIIVGQIELSRQNLTELYSSTLDVSVKENQTPIPSRITILNDKGSMVALSVPENDRHLVSRPGCVYTGTGHALIQLPPGRYTIYANRGFEYSVDSALVELRPGERKSFGLSITREVNTTGWISSDTHVHTYTHSGHGDATAHERMITLAGEGIELPVITDHNKHIDLAPVAISAGVQSWMTVVTGNEVTTPVGHFNVFPVSATSKPIDHRVDNWETLNIRLAAYGNAVIILNHANDIHNNFRPFDSLLHLSPAGMNRKGWAVPANAMEVLNSGSQQSDITELYTDWFGMLNGGRLLTPIGSSDSHDVTRFIVGQGRTYIKGDDQNPDAIDVNSAAQSIRAGKVIVSCGLMPTIVVNKKFGPGELVPRTKKAEVQVSVYGPSWARADTVMLFVNGVLHKAESVSGKGVEKWRGKWRIDVPSHDVFVSVVALGPGSGMPFWPLEKPYQPTSPRWEPKVIGVTGAVWLDGDRNGKIDTANDYARRIITASNNNIDAMVSALKKYDKAVAIQVAAILLRDRQDLQPSAIMEGANHASDFVKEGFAEVFKTENR